MLIAGVVTKSLKKDKDQRYQRMEDVAADLEGLTPPEPAARLWSRWKIKRKPPL